MSSLNRQIGAYLREVRVLKHLSRESVVARTGMHATTIRRIESGEPPVKVDAFLLLCSVLRLKASEIISSIENGDGLPSALPGEPVHHPVHTVIVDGQLYCPGQDGAGDDE